MHDRCACFSFMLIVCLLWLPAIAARTSPSEQAWLGVYVRDHHSTDADEINYGAVIEKVVKNSPAEKAGLREGDIIIKMDNKTIRDADDVTQDLRKLKPNDQVLLEVVRDRNNLTLTAILAAKPKSAPPSLSRRGHVLIHFGTPYLGVEMHDLNDDLAEYFNVKAGEGVLVMRVREGSPAERAGLKAGDVITEFDGKKITDCEDLAKAVRKADEDQVEIRYIRKGRPAKTTVNLKDGRRRVQFFGEGDDLPFYIDWPDWPFRFRCEGLKDEWEKMRKLREEIPREIELNVRLEEKKELMDSLKEEMQKIKEELKALKEHCKKEIN